MTYNYIAWMITDYIHKMISEMSVQSSAIQLSLDKTFMELLDPGFSFASN